MSEEKRICGLSLNEIKELISLITEKNVGKLVLEENGSKIVIEGNKNVSFNANMNCCDKQNPQADKVQDSIELYNECDVEGNVIKAPIIGTFYSSPSPDKPAFVSEGQKVKKGDVLFIIESMKLMNEIQSDYDGIVKKILVSNAEGIEYDQPLMIIE